MIESVKRERVETETIICPDCGGENVYANSHDENVCIDCKIAFQPDYMHKSRRMTETQRRMSIYTRLPLTSTMFVKVSGAVLDVEDIILAIQGALERNDGLFILSEVPEFKGMYLFRSPDCAIEVMVIDRGHDFLVMLMGYGEMTYVEDIIDEAVKHILQTLPYHAVPETVFNWVG